ALGFATAGTSQSLTLSAFSSCWPFWDGIPTYNEARKEDTMRFTFMLTALAVLATAAYAQDIVLYQGENFTGQRFSSNESVNDLARVGFNDRASSATIRGGSWQLCTDSYYRGQCATLRPGDYPSLRNMGLGNAVSSIREIGWQSGGQNPGPGP